MRRPIIALCSVLLAASAAQARRPTNQDHHQRIKQRFDTLSGRMSAGLRRQVSTTLKRSAVDLKGKRFALGWYVGRESGAAKGFLSSISHSGTLVDARGFLVQTRQSPRRDLSETYLEVSNGNKSYPKWDLVSRTTTKGRERLEVRSFKVLANGNSLEIITRFKGVKQINALQSTRQNRRERYQIRDASGKLIGTGQLKDNAELARKLGLKERFVERLVQAVPVGSPMGLLLNQ